MEIDVFLGVDGPPLPHLSITSVSSTLANDEDGNDVKEETTNTFFDYSIKLYENVTVILWRFAEIHWPKFVCFVVMMVALQQVCFSDKHF